MNWPTGFTWLSALKARRAARLACEPDHGDMGTAFGLDASFGPVDDEPPTLPGANAAPAVPQPWEHRLTRRSRL